jgi:hypothetical protein
MQDGAKRALALNGCVNLLQFGTSKTGDATSNANASILASYTNSNKLHTF